MLLLDRRGELVTRDEIVDRLWGRDVFIDLDTSVNTVIRKVRRALRDSADHSRFIQTVQGKGYRFIADVEPATGAALAVLPFQNLQGDADQDYVADGLTEETIVGLGQIDPEHLSVIGRTSSMAYRRTTKTLNEIGRELGVDYLLEGSVRAAAGHFRITSKLIRARDQLQVWTETYERESKDLLGLQAELGGAIARQIHLRLSPRARGHHRAPADAEPRGLRSVSARPPSLQPDDAGESGASARLLWPGHRPRSRVCLGMGGHRGHLLVASVRQ